LAIRPLLFEISDIVPVVQPDVVYRVNNRYLQMLPSCWLVQFCTVFCLGHATL